MIELAASTRTLEIGKIYNNEDLFNDVLHYYDTDQYIYTFLVVAYASYEEYREFYKDREVLSEEYWDGYSFYKISLD